jgi:RND family efflux transporter MFP subunit
MNRHSSERFLRLFNLLTLAKARLAACTALTVTLGAFGLSGCNDSSAKGQPTQKPSTTVSVVAPEQTSFERAIAATGTIAARDELIVGSDASGVRLTEVLVDVGSTVRRGQLLARADDAQLRAQLAQQEATIKSAQADLTQAQLNLDRAERLKDSGVYSVEAHQTRRTAVLAASARLDLAAAQKRELEVKIGYTRVLAPAAGVVSKKLATVGMVVQPGAELFRMIRDGELEWLAELPTHSIVQVQPGVNVSIALDDGRTMDGTVRLVAPTIDANTRNGLVHVSLPRNAGFKPGAHARGEIRIGTVQAFALPESSVLIRDGYPFVYVVDGEHIARLVKIETGARQRGFVEVSGGLKPGARVVATGAGFVKDGDLVRVAPGSSRVAQAGEQS